MSMKEDLLRMIAADPKDPGARGLLAGLLAEEQAAQQRQGLPAGEVIHSVQPSLCAARWRLKCDSGNEYLLDSHGHITQYYTPDGGHMDPAPSRCEMEDCSEPGIVDDLLDVRHCWCQTHWDMAWEQMADEEMKD